jgi:hypothetical protein
MNGAHKSLGALWVVVIALLIHAYSIGLGAVEQIGSVTDQKAYEVDKQIIEPTYPEQDLVERIPTALEESALAFKPAANIADSEDFKALRKIAEESGMVRVIVGLSALFAPEGQLSKSTTLAQRNDIAAVQSSILSTIPRLAGKAESDEHHLYTSIPYMALTVTAEELEDLAYNPAVVSIKEDKLMMPSLNYSVPYIGGERAFLMGYSGAGQTVAVLDTGFDKNHLFLAGKVVSEACYSQNNPAIGIVSLCPGGLLPAPHLVPR